MTPLAPIDMARYQAELDDELRLLLKKHCRIMAWEVPELEAREARRLLLVALRNALTTLEQEAD